MPITLALVGRTNVGKSTLFNYLTQTKAALTANTKGVTRDRRYGTFAHTHQVYTLIDTGGIDGLDDPLAPLIKQQALHAVKEADYIGLVVDGKTGLVHQDEALISLLRKTNKPILVIVSKVEGQVSAKAAISEFASLGLPLYPTSALQGKGGKAILDTLASKQVTSTSTTSLSSTANNPSTAIKIAIIGRPNVGKSTLINHLLGTQRQIVSNQAGTTRDSIEIDFYHQGEHYTLVDTAGIRRSANIEQGLEMESVSQSVDALKTSVVVMLLIDATLALTDQDLRLLERVIKSGRAIVILCNKWDKLDKETKVAFQADCKRRLRFAPFVNMAYVSGLHGIGLARIIPLAKEAYTQATKTLSTPKINRLLQKAQQTYAPPRQVKLRYAHPGGYNPPVIRIHGTHIKDIPLTYRRYLHNFYQKQLSMTGTPLKIEFIEKRNKK